ncbi:MAG: hypothetical protein IE936_08960 [Moraxella osloensis]|nr:hypothetical protein [Moraxella osloensis]
MSIKFDITDECKNDLKADPLLGKCLHKNYIAPIQSGKTVAELRGRFKPSWEVRVEGSMRDLFVQQARNKNLHHFHIGYRIYKTSSDQTYPGDVSDGIVHILVTTNQQTNETVHKLIKVCPHHNPFKLPIDRLVG